MLPDHTEVRRLNIIYKGEIIYNQLIKLKEEKENKTTSVNGLSTSQLVHFLSCIAYGYVYHLEIVPKGRVVGKALQNYQDARLPEIQ